MMYRRPRRTIPARAASCCWRGAGGESLTHVRNHIQMTNSAQPAEWWDESDPRPERPWKPRVGDDIAGRIVDIDMRTVTWKEQSRIVAVLILDTGDKEHVDTVWCMHTVLANEMRKAAPQIGEEIHISRLADGDAGYRRYRVEVNRDTPREFAWNNVPTNQGDVAPGTTDSPPAPKKDDGKLPFESDDDDLDFLK